jgi:Spy/CpxP family protein refolding chaperone
MASQHNLHEQMLSVLTAEQKAQLEQSRAQFKARRGQMRKGGDNQ